MPRHSQRIKKILYISAGSLFFGLGALGLFLPVLPTTPFWLLTAYFYVNSSPELYDSVMNLPVFGRHIRCFREYKAIPLRGKILSVVTLWLTVTVSACIVFRWWLAVVLFVTAVGVTVHILSYRTLTKEMEERLKTGGPAKKDDNTLPE